jgi:hypothetical protein
MNKRRPYEVFTEEEKGCLKRLPEEPFEISVWKECAVHSDHHIVFEQSYYSLPTRYIGKKVWARGTQRALQVFLDHQLIKTHSRSLVAGEWATDQTDYPPQKLAYLMSTPASCLKRALQYGPHTRKLMEEILEPGGHRAMRKAQAVLRLGEKWAQDLEKASQRALAYGTITYRSIRAMLEKGLLSAEEPAESAPLSELGQSFLRQATYFPGEAHS